MVTPSLLQTQKKQESESEWGWSCCSIPEWIKDAASIAKKGLDKGLDALKTALEQPLLKEIVSTVANEYLGDQIKDVDRLITMVNQHWNEFNEVKSILAEGISGFTQLAIIVNNETNEFPEDLLSTEDRRALLKLVEVEDMFSELSQKCDAIEQEYRKIENQWAEVKKTYNLKSLLEIQGFSQDKSMAKGHVASVLEQIKVLLKEKIKSTLIAQIDDKLVPALQNGKEKLINVISWLDGTEEKLTQQIESDHPPEHAEETLLALGRTKELVESATVSSSQVFDMTEKLKVKLIGLIDGL